MESRLGCRPATALALDDQDPIERVETIAEPCEAGAGLRPRSADAVVDNRHGEGVAQPVQPHRRRRRGGVLRDVRERLRDEEVRGELHGLGNPSDRASFDPHRNRHSPGERRDRSLEPLFTEEGGMDATGELAQFADRLLELVLRAGECDRRRRVVSGRGEAERDGESDETLLRAVVQVALDPAALGIRRGHDATPRRAHLRQLRAHLRREPLVLEDEAGCQPHGFHELRLVQDDGVVNEDGDLLPPRAHDRDRAAGGAGKLELLARRIDVPPVRQPVGELESRVAERQRKPVAETRAARALELDDEARGVGPPSRDHAMPATNATGTSSCRQRLATSSVAESRPVAAAFPSQTIVPNMPTTPAASTGHCERLAGPAHASRRPHRKTNATPTSTAVPASSLVDSAEPRSSASERRSRSSTATSTAQVWPSAATRMPRRWSRAHPVTRGVRRET